MSADIGQHAKGTFAAAAQGEISPDPQLRDGLPLGHQPHEILRLQARELGGERTHPDVVDARIAQQLSAFFGRRQRRQLAFGEQHPLGMRLEGDSEAAHAQSAGALDDLSDQLAMSEMDSVEIADSDNRRRHTSSRGPHKSRRGRSCMPSADARQTSRPSGS